MRKIFCLLFAGFLLLFVCRPVSAAAPDPSLQIGTAKVEITPPPGSPLAGYGRRHGKPSTGVHDPLYARALSMTNGETTFVFVSADLVLIDENLRREVLKKIKSKTALPEENLVLFATHDHSSTGAIGGRFWAKFIMGSFQEKVFQAVTSNIAESIVKSLEKTAPAEAHYGETGIDEMLENRLDEKLGGPHKLRALRFISSDGKTAGQMIFMAAHPTILPASNFLLSADFPGVLSESLEKDSPGSVALFVNGAAADLRPRAAFGEDRFQNMRIYGQKLYEHLKAINFETVSIDGPWQVFIQNPSLPKTKIRKGVFRAPSLIGNRVFPRDSYFQAVQTGKLLFLSFPGEIASETGREIEAFASSQGFLPFFIGYAHDYIGYVVPERYYKDPSQYESQASFYGPKMDAFIKKQAEELIGKIRDGSL